jgi:DNA-binding NarL/FixJ family response regulator
MQVTLELNSNRMKAPPGSSHLAALPTGGGLEAESRIAVMIASDHPIMRDGLRLRIQQESDMYVVCDGGDLEQILHEFQICRPDVVVIDLHLPRGVGVRAMESIRAVSPGTPLVVLANYPGEVHEARRPGQAAVVTVPKISANEQIIPGIRKAIAEGHLMSPARS